MYICIYIHIYIYIYYFSPPVWPLPDVIVTLEQIVSTEVN